MKKYIPRNYYFKKVIPFKDKEIIKVITGQRRVGKSYVLLQIMDEIKKIEPKANFIYIDKELQKNSFITDEISLRTFIDSKLKARKKNYLFIDEIQEIARFELCIRSLLNEEKCDIYCSGSNATMLSGELATMLSGRYIEIQIHSLSYNEFLIFHKLKDSDESLKKYLTIGGMPYLKNIVQDETTIFEYLKNVYSTILLRDVVARENIRNVAFLESLIAFISNNVGSLLSSNNISKYLKSQQTNIPTQSVLNYLKALGNAYFIYKVSRSAIQGLKIFEISDKFYFEDLGLRNCIRTFKFNDEIHKLMENAVYIHLIRLNFRVFVGKLDDKEIDFVAEKNGEKIYIQVCYLIFNEETKEREFGNLLAIKDNYKKMVISMDPIISKKTYKGIEQIHLREFLANDEI
jgi:predicted AAA+ superfamily ATPase